MRILIFHGYLLRGTGSNIYNASLARALAAQGHEVHLVCQERDPGFHPPGVTVHNPDIGRILPVYVADEYEGFDAVPFADLTDEQLDHYIAANVGAVEAVADVAPPDVALANHLVMGPCVLARAIGGRVPIAVKVHGSALEYTVRPNPERFLPYAREGLDAAAGVLVGSRHTAESLWEVVGDGGLPARTRLGPPGVDVAAFRQHGVDDAAAALAALAARLADAPAAAWGGDTRAGPELARLDPREGPIVGYVGKLIVSKGVDLLLAGWPLVVDRVPDARLVIVGFGEYRDGLESLVAALGRADLDAVVEIAARGRELEGGPVGELGMLRAFAAGLDGERRRVWLDAAPRAAERVGFTGRLEHTDLPGLLPALSAQVVPSTFPEAFGMVAAEAACCGALPVSAAHSGLAEVSAQLAPALPDDLARLLSFELGEGAVEAIAERLVGWLSLPDADRARLGEALSERARARFGWERVADGVIAAAQGRLSELSEPV